MIIPPIVDLLLINNSFQIEVNVLVGTTDWVFCILLVSMALRFHGILVLILVFARRVLVISTSAGGYRTWLNHSSYEWCTHVCMLF